jgi:hypothetical protein
VCFLEVSEGYTVKVAATPHLLLLQLNHRVGKVPSFFSSRRNWDYPNPSPAGECAPPPLWYRGRAHSLASEGGGDICTLWYSVYIIILSGLYIHTAATGQDSTCHIEGEKTKREEREIAS